jgi:hypothetical protein
MLSIEEGYDNITFNCLQDGVLTNVTMEISAIEEKEYITPNGIYSFTLSKNGTNVFLTTAFAPAVVLQDSKLASCFFVPLSDEFIPNTIARKSKINDIKIVPTKQKLGVLEVPLGGIGAVVPPKLEITDKFSNHLVYDCVPKFNKQIPVLKELILHTKPIMFNIEGASPIIKSSGIILSNDGQLSYDTAIQVQISGHYGEEFPDPYIEVS